MGESTTAFRCGSTETQDGEPCEHHVPFEWMLCPYHRGEEGPTGDGIDTDNSTVIARKHSD